METQVNSGSSAERKIRITLGSDSEVVPMSAYQATADKLFAKHGGIPKIEYVIGNDSQPTPEPPKPSVVLPPVVAKSTKAKTKAVKSGPAVVVSPPVVACTGCGELSGCKCTGAAIVKMGLAVAPPVVALAIVPPAPPVVLTGGIDTVGQARSEADLEAARKAGWAPAQTVYTRGMRVNSTGVANARKFRAEFDAKPLVGDYCDDVIKVIQAENRQDLAAVIAELKMVEKTGALIVGNPDAVLMVEDRAFRDLVAGLRMPAGAPSYLGGVWPELRAGNINAWIGEWVVSEEHEREDYQADLARYEAGHEKGEKAPAEPYPAEIVLRTRVTGGEDRAVFGAVSESYTSYDVDQIAKAIKLATPEGARGTVTYDGYRARFEVLFHSNVKPEDYVAGEFFKAGVIIRTDDTGGGSLRGNAVVWQNLCLNLIIIDEANQDLFRIRHMGDVGKMAASFREGFEKGLAKLDHFVKAWGFASRESLAAYLPEEAKGLSLVEALPGFFNGIIERELVPVRGRASEAVPSLVKAWKGDRSSATVKHGGFTRAALANAFTNYAHTVDQGGPWFEDEIQRAAGALVQSRAPIPYLQLAKGA